MKVKCLIAVAAVALWATAAQAAWVHEVNVSPNQTVHLDVDNVVGADYSGNVYAGIYNLTVDGVATPSLCIDVQRQSGSGTYQYEYLSLPSAPLSWAGPMGDTAADTVSRLWAQYFSGATSSSLEAAALQVAVWQTIDAAVDTYTITVSGNAAVTTRAAEMLADLASDPASLVALVNETYQNYVVPVPEPGTMIAGMLLLLPFGASAMRILRRKV